MTTKRLLAIAFRPICIISIAGIFSGCSSLYEEPDDFLVHKDAILPQKFLYSNFTPLNDWLDTPVRVAIIGLPLSEVFDEAVFSGMNYNLYDLPVDEPLISVDQLGISRRQLLWSLAQDHQLKMNLVFPRDEVGTPYVINIFSRTPLEDVVKVEPRTERPG